jgi:hypothetical protein
VTRPGSLRPPLASARAPRRRSCAPRSRAAPALRHGRRRCPRTAGGRSGTAARRAYAWVLVTSRSSMAR